MCCDPINRHILYLLKVQGQIKVVCRLIEPWVLNGTKEYLSMLLMTDLMPPPVPEEALTAFFRCPAAAVKLVLPRDLWWW